MNLFIVDVSSFMYKNYYALPKLLTSKGLEVGALYGFIRLITKIIKEKSNYLFACYDSKKNIRKEFYQNYKANRKAIDEELAKQIDISKNLLGRIGVKYLEIDGYEADDLIASAVEKFKNLVDSIIITTSDKDLMQLIGGNVYVWDGKSQVYFDEKFVLDKYGVSPKQIKDMLVLCGDSSDNIEGIEGIGPKTAVKLLLKYGSVDNIFSQQNSDDFYVKKILENRDRIEKNIELVTLKNYIDIPYNLDDLLVKIDKNKAIEMLSFLEFKNIALELGISKEEEKFDEIDSKTFLAMNPYYISIFENEVYFLKYKTRLENIKSLLFNNEIKKYFYNAKDIFHNVLTDDIFNYDDVMIGYYLIWGSSRKPDPFKIIQEKHFVQTSNPAFYFKEIMDEINLKLKEYKMYDLYVNEIELSKVLYRMEKNGIKVDLSYLENIKKEFKDKLDEIYKEFCYKSQVKINLNSPKQVSEFIFKKLNIKLDKEHEKIFKTKTGNYSTSEDVLKFLMPYNPQLISLIVSYREYSKLLSFIDVLVSEVKNGKIYTHFDQVSTTTGRLTSYKPNLQNIPIKSLQGLKIRNAFLPEDGYIFVSFDYSQIDLRVIAHLSKDKNLIEAFKKGEDIHRRTASSIFGVDYFSVTEEMRRIAKTINFGIIYGLTPIGLASELLIDRSMASQYIKSYFEIYPGVKKWSQ
ncbi:MAG: DNA polymerase, partial [Elusimicrobiales bacterium]|nr:DNA polymerase [Elusimicrobiales bacterium]